MTISFATLLLAAAVAPSLPPKTETHPVRDVVHGVEVVDELRWLEGSDAPELETPDPELDRRVAAWTDAQNAYTRERLDSLPGRAALEARLEELMEVGEVGSPAMRRNRYFYRERRGDQNQGTVKVREGHDGAPRTLLDLNALDPAGLTALSFFEPSHDGELAAFGLFKAGDENSTLHVLEVDSGTWLAEEIPGKVQGVAWLADDSGFLYHRLADVQNPYSTLIKVHRLGTHHRQDPVLFKQYEDGPLATTWGPYATLSEDGRWMILGYWTGTDSHDLWVVDFDRWQATGELVRVDMMVGERAVAYPVVVGDRAFFRTSLGAPNYRAMVADLNDPGHAGWRELIPEREGQVLQSLSAARGILVARYLVDATSRVELFSYDGEALGTLELPGIGSARLLTQPDRTEAFLAFSSFHLPETLYRLDLKTGERSVWAEPEVPVDPSGFAVRQERYRSKDGTEVSLFLVHKKGLRKDGKRPVVLSGYGGFGISMTPGFRATLMPWLEAGGVMAVANLRGGGERGEAWHRAGMLENKQNVFDDFIAAAEHLIEAGYTRPEKLAIRGGSNGGLLTGAALVQRPDLFGAVISAVPLLDMLRYQHFLMARFWVPEYGTAEDPEQAPFLHAYSPYHHVEKGVRYPATLLTAGENDTRVHPLHARKMAARLQASTAGSPEEDPILLWVDRSAGHGRGKPLDLQVESAADQLIFLMWQLGMLKG